MFLIFFVHNISVQNNKENDVCVIYLQMNKNNVLPLFNLNLVCKRCGIFFIGQIKKISECRLGSYRDSDWFQNKRKNLNPIIFRF